jgi:uncharacterized RmlC-like cupin family protein
MGRIDLPPGIVTDAHECPGDIVGVMTDGWAGVTWSSRSDWLEMRQGDGCYVPSGVPYRLMNVSDQPATFVFGAAPRYW